MRRSHPVGPRGISSRLDRLEPVATLLVCSQNNGPFKVRIERCGIGIAWMRVAPVGVGLPDFNLRVANRLTFEIEHPPHDIEDLTFGPPRPPRHPGQIGILIKALQWIVGTQYLLWRAMLGGLRNRKP